MFSVEPEFLSEKLLKKLEDNEYCPLLITASAAASASAQRAVPVYTSAFKYNLAKIACADT